MITLFIAIAKEGKQILAHGLHAIQGPTINCRRTFDESAVGRGCTKLFPDELGAEGGGEAMDGVAFNHVD